ncbi:hypothetical protein DMA11_06455 [Marinilabiliaceae bacterium JC017]|nr:hypothetical protein DMA11_06455 [Marinilabiliaceae bacterium JC017]
MEKEALINIILKDIQEISMLVETFKGKPAIRQAFIRLAKTKIHNIEEELVLLEELQELKESVVTQVTDESLLTSQPIERKPEVIQEIDIAESSSRFFAEEAGNDETEAVEPPASEVKEEPIEPVREEPLVIEKKVIIAEPQLVHEDVESAVTKEESVVEPVPEKEMPEPIAVEKPAPEIITEKPAPIPEPQPVKEPVTLGEKMRQANTSVNDRLSSKSATRAQDIKLLGKPVDDIRKALGLNDRFYYQRELFNGNADLFNQTLDQINRMHSFEAASKFLVTDFHWDQDNEVAESFLKVVKRRFL